MKFIRLALLALVMLGVFAVLHYALPQTDVVRIVNTDVRRMDFGANAIFYSEAGTGSNTGGNRDIRFIETVEPDGDPMVYRNEDTGWSWPFYFKFDSADLQASAADLVSTREAPIWIAVRHYGWRSRLLSAFPNAISIERVDGPDVKFFPWLTLVILTTLLVAALLLWRVAQIFWRRTVRPLFKRGDDI
ncbi:DUF1523 family protein [Palleronia abyssalis]|uniref:DUF1523 domain-containing protein n=1 Tax=Palleronia abyssalis TaxID=1501240 RepID=A0A2R8BXC7_9RHOB|nr:DUF1523 family protein [Palleronia abyssalis]SPJ24834.1 hypothetical protein PAA8504_02674 [Palleronia abyssalis]